ncbi:MAG: rRNA maturation RNase YbeY [Thermomicrobiales bacterium]|nr:rRNA maturation RNase YbeY [Thermomicrobiales bacterium]
MIEHIVTIEIDAPLPADFGIDSVHQLITHILQTEEVEEPWQIGIQFVDDPTMQSAHVEYMGIDGPTDIMTFPYADEEDVWGDSEAGGDLMISVDRAAANAADAGWSTANELHFLIAHGLLHLLGWDDHYPADREAMLARQHALLASWRSEG